MNGNRFYGAGTGLGSDSVGMGSPEPSPPVKSLLQDMNEQAVRLIDHAQLIQDRFGTSLFRVIGQDGLSHSAKGKDQSPQAQPAGTVNSLNDLLCQLEIELNKISSQVSAIEYL